MLLNLDEFRKISSWHDLSNFKAKSQNQSWSKQQFLFTGAANAAGAVGVGTVTDSGLNQISQVVSCHGNMVECSFEEKLFFSPSTKEVLHSLEGVRPGTSCSCDIVRCLWLWVSEKEGSCGEKT